MDIWLFFFVGYGLSPIQLMNFEYPIITQKQHLNQHSHHYIHLYYYYKNDQHRGQKTNDSGVF